MRKTNFDRFPVGTGKFPKANGPSPNGSYKSGVAGTQHTVTETHRDPTEGWVSPTPESPTESERRIALAKEAERKVSESISQGVKASADALRRALNHGN